MSPDLVGRSGERAAVESLIQDARGGSLTALIISGEPGSGKTTLLHHVLERAGRRGFRMLRIDADRMDGAIPFAALRLAIDDLRVSADDAASTEALNGLSAIVDRVTPPDDDSCDVAEATRGLLETWAFRQPVVVAVDDLHAADPATIQLVDGLMRSERHQRLLVVATVTPCDLPAERVADFRRLADQGRVSIIELDALSDGDLAVLAERHLGRGVDPQLVEVLGDVTGGLPFLAVNILRSLADPAASAELDDAWQQRSFSATRVRTAVRSRLTGLGVDAHRVAAAVAVLGDVPCDRRADIEQLTRLPPERTEAGLSRLVDGRMLTIDTSRYRFRHRAVRDAVYADIGPASRRRWHAEAARLRLDDRAARSGSVLDLADHLRASAEGLDPVAARVLVKAGDLCSHIDPQAAADWYQAALARLGPDDDAADETRCRLSDALRLSGDHAAAAEQANAVLTSTAKGGHRARAAVLAATPFWLLGDIGRAGEIVDATLVDPDVRSADLLLFRALLSVWAGDLDHARVLLSSATTLGAADHPWLADLVDMHLHLAAGGCEEGWQLALRACEQSARGTAGASTMARLSATIAASIDLDPRAAVDLADAVPLDGPLAPWFHGVAAYARLRQGHLSDALAAAQRAHTVIGEHSVLMFSTHATLIEAGAELGEFRVADTARADIEAAGHLPGQSLLDAATSHLMVVRGDYAAAERLLASAEERETAAGRIDALGIILARRVDVALADSDHERARSATTRLQALPTDQASVAVVMSQLLAGALVHRDVATAERAHQHATRFGLEIDAARALGALGTARNDASLVVEAYEQLGRLRAVYRQRILAKELRRLGRRVPSQRGAPHEITAAERGVATLVAQGLTNRQVAEQANLSPKTVEVYLSRIYAKTGCSSRVELAIAVNDGRL